MADALTALLRPRAIALVGASVDLDKVNGRPLAYLRRHGYRGTIHPVNPKYREIAGLRCYAAIAEVPGDLDLAVIMVPARDAEAALREAGARGVPAAVVFASGFAELGEEGRALERRLAAAARESGIRLLGPNTLGFVNALDAVTPTFSQYAGGAVPAGPAAFVTQSGAFGTGIAALARARGFGFGYFINIGNEADLSFAEVMEAVLADPRIRVGAGYIEGLKDYAALGRVAAKARAAGKPIVVTKVGRKDAGHRAAASHTGALAGEDRVLDALFRQLGILRARNEEHLLDIVEALAYCPPPQGRGVALVTISGGAGVLLADRAEEVGLAVPALAPEIQAQLRRHLPDYAGVSNPVDTTATFLVRPALLRELVQTAMSDARIHAGIIWLQLMESHAETLVEVLAETVQGSAKPIIVCWLAAPPAALAGLRARGVCVLRGAEPAVDAMAALVAFGEASRRRQPAPLPALPLLAVPQGAGIVDTMAAQDLLRAAKVPLAEARRARDGAEMAAIVGAFDVPLALKIDSPDLPHKSDIGGVRLGVTPQDAPRVAEELLAVACAHAPQARLRGVTVQPMAPPGVEIVVGLKRDPAAGLVLMVGLGGVFIEVMRDVAFRVLPVDAEEVGTMLDQLRGRPLLEGARGRPPVDRAALVELILRVAALGAALDDRLESLELNPVIAGADFACAVDWLVELRG